MKKFLSLFSFTRKDFFLRGLKLNCSKEIFFPYLNRKPEFPPALQSSNNHSFEYLKKRSFQKITVRFQFLYLTHTHIYTHTLYYSILPSNKLSFPPDRSKQTREGIESALTREGDLHRVTSAWIKARGRGGGGGGKTRFPDEKLERKRG